MTIRLKIVMSQREYAMKIFILFFMLLSLQSYGRSPAVLPITGLSIDEMPVAKPGANNGVDFTKGTSKRLPANQVNYKTGNLETRDIYKTEATPSSNYLYLIFALLPFALWYGTFRALKLNEVSAPSEAQMYTFTPKKKAKDKNQDAS